MEYIGVKGDTVSNKDKKTGVKRFQLLVVVFFSLLLCELICAGLSLPLLFA